MLRTERIAVKKCLLLVSILLPTIYAPAQSGIVIVGGLSHPCTVSGVQSAISAAEATGTNIVDMRSCTSLTISSQIDVGDASHSIELDVPSTGNWSFTITDGASCGFKLYSGSSIVGKGIASGGSPLRIAAASNANADSMICTYGVRAIYTRIDWGAVLYNNNGGVFAHGLVYFHNVYDGSLINSLEAANYSGIGFNVDGACCGAAFYSIVSDGNGGSEATPFVVDSNSMVSVHGFNCFSCSIAHAGPSNHELEIKQTAGFTGPVNFYGLHVETFPGATEPHIEVTQAQDGANFFGGICNIDDAETVPCFDIADTTSNQTTISSFTFFGGSGVTSRIEDHVNNITLRTQPFGYDNVVTYSTLAPVARRASGLLTLSGGSGSVVFRPGFEVSPGCQAFDMTNGSNSVQISVTISGISFFSGTGGDTISWHCDGRPN
jgi:hypothetical protein